MQDWLAAAAEQDPRRLALKLASGVECSYGTLSWRAAQMAESLEQAGVRHGDRVAWLGRSTRRGIPLLFALARLGVVFVPLNTRLTQTELLTQAVLASVRMLICERVTEAQAAPLAGLLPVRSWDEPQVADVEQMPVVPVDEAYTYLSRHLVPHAVQSVVFTSGTTGTPKGAQITWFNHYASAQASAERLGTTADDGWLLTLPLFHVGGMTIPMRAALACAAVIEFDGRGGFDPVRLIAALQDPRVTLVSLVPTMLHRLLETGFDGTPHLKAILLGGAAAPIELLERAWARGLPVAPTYGLTEACSQVATMRPPDAPRKPGSVGKPLHGTTVSIQHEDGTSAAPGEIGEIVVRGPTVFAGYLNAPTDRALQDGALYTGDMGYHDTDGDLFFVQRRTDLIVSGGENVYPAEVEAVLRTYPSVADACVVGLPHPEWGQQVAAAVVLVPGAYFDADLLDAWCRDQLAGYKRPRLIRSLDVLPMTATGKVLRQKVAELLANER